ncbi:MAG: hypothetical protein ACOYVF_06930 [Candidatus Zixiibacteriota bacterium]
MQIDETSGGRVFSQKAMAFGLGGYVDDSYNNYFSIFTQKVYYKSAGTYTFRLEGMPYVSVGEGAYVYVWYPRLLSTNYPTSYGSVASMVSSSEAGEFDEVTIETIYKVDIRELELKAKDARLREQQAHIERLEAERELECARREAKR